MKMLNFQQMSLWGLELSFIKHASIEEQKNGDTTAAKTIDSKVKFPHHAVAIEEIVSIGMANLKKS